MSLFFCFQGTDLTIAPTFENSNEIKHGAPPLSLEGPSLLSDILVQHFSIACNPLPPPCFRFYSQWMHKTNTLDAILHKFKSEKKVQTCTCRSLHAKETRKEGHRGRMGAKGTKGGVRARDARMAAGERERRDGDKRSPHLVKEHRRVPILTIKDALPFSVVPSSPPKLQPHTLVLYPAQQVHGYRPCTCGVQCSRTVVQYGCTAVQHGPGKHCILATACSLGSSLRRTERTESRSRNKHGSVSGKRNVERIYVCVLESKRSLFLSRDSFW